MKHEFHAHFAFALQDSATQGFAIPWLVGEVDRLPEHWREIDTLQDDFARLSLLAQAVVTNRKEEARKGSGKMGGGHQFWIENRAAEYLRSQRHLMQLLGIEPNLPDISLLPQGSFILQFTFTLRKPFISKDDTEFYIQDNPIKKEWVFKVPYVAPSQWKGALRSAMMRTLVSDLQTGQKDEGSFVAERLRLYRLFGNEKNGVAEFLNRTWALHRVGPQPKDNAEKWNDDYQDALKGAASQFDEQLSKSGYRKGEIEGFQGRLHFFPTFFDQIGLEVINPHDRKTGVGERGPIFMECVPKGCKGELLLLYVPFGMSDHSEEMIRKEAAQDLEVLAKGIQAMLTTYGFGAKTSSGYGVAEQRLVDGQLVTRSKKIPLQDLSTLVENVKDVQF